MRIFIGIIAGVALLVAAGLFVAARLVARPPGLGDALGELMPCPNTPNCVSSLSTRPGAAMPAIPYTGSREAARAKLLRVLEGLERTRVVVATDSYVYAEARSRVFGFVDDVEFRFDDGSKEIHFRSASRLGRRDFGVNRSRMETIRGLVTGD